MKFLDVRTDFAFKKVFGSDGSKDRLISFLNATIDFDDNKQITDLEIVDPYNIPQLKGMKDTYVDVKAKLDDDTMVIIEMQVLNHQGFENRILFNTAKNYSIQLVKGERYDLLKPVIALTIVDFDMFTDNEDIINSFKLLNKKDFSDYSDDIELIFVELNKFTKHESECKTTQDKWFYFLKNAGDLTLIPDNIPKQLQSAYEVSNESGMSHEELELQYKKREFIAIQKGALALATEHGLEKGIEQGIEQGELTQNIKNANAMIQEGIALTVVSKVTGLSLAQLNNLDK